MPLRKRESEQREVARRGGLGVLGRYASGVSASVLLSNPDLTGRLFFPSDRTTPPPTGASDYSLEVPGARLHLRMHAGAGPTLLLLHGNGENVCDWDEAAPSFARRGVRLAVFDYRGYGKSTGVPTMANVFDDAQRVRDALTVIAPGPLVVMGRSLGSAPAWRLAASTPDLAAVVIDSGFTDVDAFSRRRGIDPQTLPADEREALDPIPRIAASHQPLLLLHGEEDRAITIREAEAALAASPAPDKSLVRLPGKGHNDLWSHPDYDRALGAFLSRIT